MKRFRMCVAVLVCVACQPERAAVQQAAQQPVGSIQRAARPKVRKPVQRESDPCDEADAINSPETERFRRTAAQYGLTAPEMCRTVGEAAISVVEKYQPDLLTSRMSRIEKRRVAMAFVNAKINGE